VHKLHNRRHTAFLFLSTSLAKFASSSLISFNRDAKRSLFSAMTSCIFIVICHALTKELRGGEITKSGREEIERKDRTDAPSFTVIHGI
jgi:hypothetical protein